jgi:antitoxin component of MazEF toxin-antitoxin module
MATLGRVIMAARASGNGMSVFHTTYCYYLEIYFMNKRPEVALDTTPRPMIGSTATWTGSMTIKQRDIYTAKFFKRGGSYAILVPPDIRDLMGFTIGDTVLMNCEDDVLWIVRATKRMVIDRDKMSGIFDRLYEEKRKTNGRNQ